MPDNKLYYGDNLDVVRRYVRDESVDLVYLDPPFNSRQDYNVLFAESQAQERLGYPTQKPEALLQRIIEASNEGDAIIDPFCGCGAAISVAQRLNRRWIGIDITHLAIGLIKKRLDDAFGESVRSTYEVIGEPVDLAGAQELADHPEKVSLSLD